jgi:hypothetical protein
VLEIVRANQDLTSSSPWHFVSNFVPAVTLLLCSGWLASQLSESVLKPRGQVVECGGAGSMFQPFPRDISDASSRVAYRSRGDRDELESEMKRDDDRNMSCGGWNGVYG